MLAAGLTPLGYCLMLVSGAGVVLGGDCSCLVGAPLVGALLVRGCDEGWGTRKGCPGRLQDLLPGRAPTGGAPTDVLGVCLER